MSPGQAAPAGFAGARRVTLDETVLAHPAAAAAVLADHWVRRVPVVVELGVDNDAMRAREVCETPPHALDTAFAFERERLQFYTWANTYDCRRDTPVWWHGVLAQRRGGLAASQEADVVLGDGEHAWVDGGPRGPVGDLRLVHRESVALGRVTPLGRHEPGAALAADQLAAVRHPSGPARIVAPAGSGKTRVLTERMRHLLVERGYEPQLVTAVAYNTRAAGEMRRRLHGTGGQVRTLHSLGLSICNRVDERRLIHERDVRGILDGLVSVGRVPNTDPYQAYLEALSDVRLGLRDPAQVEASRDDIDDFAEVFARYRQILDERRLIDFDEQIYRAVEILLTRPDIRTEVQRRCTHLLVDEFQDLTPAFLLLIRLAAAPSLQVFGVGDDDQTIYSHSGASPAYLIGFGRLFPGASEYALEVNYRCPEVVVSAASTLLGHNRVRVGKTIRAAAVEVAPEALSTHRVATGAMAQRTVGVIRGWLDDGASPEDVAVLARVNSALLGVQIALGEAGIARTAPLDASVLSRTGIRTALAYLRIALDPERIRRDDVLETLNRPARKVKGAVAPLLRRSRTWSLSQLADVGRMLDGAQAERFTGYLTDLRLLTVAVSDGASSERLLDLVRNRVGLGEAMDALDSSRSRPEGSSHGDDLDALAQLASLHPDVATYQAWLTQRLADPGDPAGVSLSSVHRVKGMEWDRVVVFAANQGLFPHRLSDDVEEERRVFHVALTRCRTHVAVVANRDATSPFVAELSRPAPRHDRAGTASKPAPAGAAHVDGDRAWVEVGATIAVPGGFSGQVVAVDDAGARVDLDVGGEVALAFGAPVTVDGSAACLSPAPRIPRRGARPRLTGLAGTSESGEPVDEGLLDALKAWRARTAAEAGHPAYIVLHDRHLEVIARRRPATVRELAACPGIGPTKLDRYADDLLELVERSGS